MEYRPYIHSAGTVVLKGRKPQGWVRMVSYQLNQLHSGTAVVGLEGSPPVTLGPGDAWMVPPGRGVKLDLVETPVESTWIHFSVDQNRAWHNVDPATSFTGSYSRSPEMCQPSPEATWGVRIEGLVPGVVLSNLGLGLREVASRWCRADRVATMSANIELERLVMLWIDASTNRRRTRPSTAATAVERIRRAEVAAWQHIGADFGVKEMAALSNMSRAHFSRAYRQLRGHPVRDTLRRMRMSEARRLLAETSMTVTEIAARLNYSSPMAFERMFKGETGQTPSSWRRTSRPAG
jgi:AraC-like DNA-binding protein